MANRFLPQSEKRYLLKGIAFIIISVYSHSGSSASSASRRRSRTAR